MQVLLIEDDPEFANCLIRGLTRYGFELTWAPTGQDGLAAAVPDLVLLDVGLPDLDGLDVCRELRDRDVPLIVISGRGTPTDRIVGLELGADDYLVKPFLIRELVARIRAVRRRICRTDAPGVLSPSRGVHAVGPSRDWQGHRPTRETYGRVAVDRRARRVFLDDVELALSPKQYALLEYLTSRIRALVTRESIMSAVWDSNWCCSTKTLDESNLAEVVGHPDSDAARAHVLRAGSEPPAGPPDPSPLTGRGLEIAALVAKGLTNRQIASALGLSPRTVDGHVENILARLGFECRAQIASWWTANHGRV
ncbi:response regulator [Streptomyces sp. NPDC050121]|uniref:response regulator n=1 Tax=Streptomyces sp. NPDC050121 TaxID=3365601 RepID=UPI0037AF4C31